MSSSRHTEFWDKWRKSEQEARIALRAYEQHPKTHSFPLKYKSSCDKPTSSCETSRSTRKHSAFWDSWRESEKQARIALREYDRDPKSRPFPLKTSNSSTSSTSVSETKPVYSSKLHRSAGCPLTTKQLALTVNGCHTDILITPFQDKIFIVITQLAKIGTMILARKEGEEEGPTSFSTTTVLGKRDEEVLSVYARALIGLISQSSPKALLLGISLKDHSPSTFKAIFNLISSPENRLW
eukprot:GILJ01010640.1.p1 GENE.GILJ01010640.1~~GILJ01010640.1.p1  ORF type:complete len:248 (+),score=23.72 GILJ01010640.1:28-744(+)